MIYLFWSAIGTLAYTYVLFPAIVLLRGLLRVRPVRLGDIAPAVTIVMAARNEADIIAAKLENLLALDYEAARFNILVASDGSSDGTDEIVARYADRGARLLSLPRVGKAAALNAAVAAASGEILVFSDANSMYARDALRQIVRPFADPDVGGVAGDQRYLDDAISDGVASGERRYWDFDRILKHCESRAGNAVSATGAIYAIRRDLFEPIPDGVTDDFFTSTGVVTRGKRLVFCPEAVAYEPVASSGRVEFGRKVRIMTRGLRGVQARRELLDPRRHGFYALQLFSHKVLRRLMAVPLLLAAVSSAALSRRRFFRVAAAAQAAFYGSAAVGLLARRPSTAAARVLELPAYFCLVNAAALRAVWNLLRDERIDRWEPERSVTGRPGTSGAPLRADKPADVRSRA